MAARLASGYHPLVHRLIESAEDDTTVLSTFAIGQRPGTWPLSRATVVGDAIDAVPPFGAHGGNTALRDAALLGGKLVDAHLHGESVESAIAAYQTEMPGYAFKAVDTAAGMMRRLTGSGRVQRMVMTRLLPSLHRVTVPEPSIITARRHRRGTGAGGHRIHAGRTGILPAVRHVPARRRRAARPHRHRHGMPGLPHGHRCGHRRATCRADQPHHRGDHQHDRRLERAGYVTAERDPADRRRVIVTLIPERVEDGVRLYASYGNAISEVLSRHSTEEIRLLTRHYDEMSAVYRAQLATLTKDESP